METEKIQIVDEIPYNYGIGNEVTFWAFQAPETPDKNLVADILEMTSAKSLLSSPRLKFDFSQYRASKEQPWQIPQTPEALVQLRENLLAKGTTLGIRSLNSKRLNTDTSIGWVPERVMDCPHKPTLIDIVDSNQANHYANDIVAERYRRENLDIEVKRCVLRSLDKKGILIGFIPGYTIEIPERKWKRMVLCYDPKNELLMKIFKPVVSNKILEYLINKGKSELFTLPTVSAPPVYTPKPIVPAPIVKKDPRKTQKQDPVKDRRKTQKLDPIQ